MGRIWGMWGWASRQGSVKGTSQGLTWTTGGDICLNKGQMFLREEKVTSSNAGTLGLRSKWQLGGDIRGCHKVSPVLSQLSQARG